MPDKNTIGDHLHDLMLEVADLRQQVRDLQTQVRQLEAERDQWQKQAMAHD